jgi:hypothetical protein
LFRLPDKVPDGAGFRLTPCPRFLHARAVPKPLLNAS